MSLLRDSKGKLAMLASLDRRLANDSLLYHHTMFVCLFAYSCCLLLVHWAKLLYQTDNYENCHDTPLAFITEERCIPFMLPLVPFHYFFHPFRVKLDLQVHLDHQADQDMR